MLDKYTIKQARNLSGLTQEDVASRLKVNPVTYIKYEKYETIMRMDKAFTFSKIVGIDVSNIIFFEKELQKNCTKEKQEV